MGFQHEFATARHQQTDGKCERAIKTLKTTLRAFIDHEGKGWLDCLPFLEFQWNNTPRAIYDQLTPFEVDLGRSVATPGFKISPALLQVMKAPDRKEFQELNHRMQQITTIVRDRIARAQDNYARYYDRGRIPIKYAKGDLVELNRAGIDVEVDRAKGSKLSAIWIGPFPVIKAGPHPDTYELDIGPTKLSGLWPYFHVNVLRPYVKPSHPHRRNIAPPPIEVEGVPEYQIEAIQDERILRGKRQFLVKWTGYPQPTWEPASLLRNAEALDRWRREHPPVR